MKAKVFIEYVDAKLNFTIKPNCIYKRPMAKSGYKFREELIQSVRKCRTGNARESINTIFHKYKSEKIISGLTLSG